MKEGRRLFAGSQAAGMKAFALGWRSGTAAALTGGDSRVREWSEVVAFSEDGGSGRERTECSISEQRCFFGYPLASL